MIGLSSFWLKLWIQWITAVRVKVCQQCTRPLTFVPSVVLLMVEPGHILRLLNLLAGELIPPEDETGEAHRMNEIDIQLWYLICFNGRSWFVNLMSPVAKVSAVWRHRNLRLAYIVPWLSGVWCVSCVSFASWCEIAWNFHEASEAQHHFFHLSEFLKSTPLHYFQVRFRLVYFWGGFFLVVSKDSCDDVMVLWLHSPKTKIRLEELWSWTSWTCWHAISQHRCFWGKVGMQRLRGGSHCRRARRKRSIVRTVCYLYCRCSVATDENPSMWHDFGVRTWRPNMAREEKR